MRAPGRLIVAHTMGALAVGMPWPVLMAMLWVPYEDNLVAGIFAAARTAPYLVLSWFVGASTARWTRTSVFRAASGVRAVALVGCAAAANGGAVGAACVLAVLAVALGTPSFPVAAAAMPALDRRRRSTSLLVTADVAAFPLGAALGGLAVAWPAWVGIGGAAVLAWLGTGLAWTVDLGAEVGRERYGRVMLAVLRNRTARGGVLAIASLNASLGAVGVALLPLAVDRWQAGEAGYGLLTTMLGLGALAAPLLAAGWRSDEAGPWFAAAAVPLVLIAVVPGWTWAVPVVIAFGALATQAECAATVTLQRAVPDSQRAAALGLADAALYAAATIGAASAPWVIAHLGTAALLAVQLALALGGVMALGGIRRGGLGDLRTARAPRYDAAHGGCPGAGRRGVR